MAGDAAFLLNRLDEALYQINLGNVLPGERVMLVVTWAETLRWAGNELRYRLPNLVAPHYGDPQRAGIAPEDMPGQSGLAAYELTIEVLLAGALAEARVSCPSHAIVQPDVAEGRRIRLAAGEWLDRSFTLVMQCATPPALVAWQAADGDEVALLACCHAPVAADLVPPQHLTLVIDGSGSMEGVSMTQARQAAVDIVRSLRDEDSCSLLAFGSAPKLLTHAPLLVGRHRALLLALCRELDADLGGTEMQQALAQAIAVTPEGGDILMVTDGQVHFSDADIRRFARHRRRLFTIGVGHATSEKVLRRLSEASGGFCALVSPNEEMAAQVMQHFRRLRAPRQPAQWQLPGKVQRQALPAVLFAGDTAMASARLDSLAANELQVELPQASLRAVIMPATGMLRALLPRLVAAQLLPEDNLRAAREEAVRYQLVTEHTSMLAVLTREGDTSVGELPVVIDVPQMPVAPRRMSCASMSPDMHPGALNSRVSLRDDLLDHLLDEELVPLLGAAWAGRATTDDWLAACNDRLRAGAALASLLDEMDVPQAWQPELQSAPAQWPKRLQVLAVIVLYLEALPAAALRQYRPLVQAVRGLRRAWPEVETVIAEVRTGGGLCVA